MLLQDFRNTGVEVLRRSVSQQRARSKLELLVVLLRVLPLLLLWTHLVRQNPALDQLQADIVPILNGKVGVAIVCLERLPLNEPRVHAVKAALLVASEIHLWHVLV